jgi:hypothetical protein
VAKYHPGSRCTLRVSVGEGVVALKAYHRRPAREAEAMRILRGAGLASGEPPTVSPLLAADLELRLLAFAWLQGPTALDLIAAGGGARAGALAAEWLRAAAESGVELDRRRGAADTLADLATWLGHMDEAGGDLQREGAERAARLAREEPPLSREGLQHGSLSVHHVIDLGGGPGVLDLDGLSIGPVERDAGRFLATLARTGVEQPGLAAEARRAEEAFRAAVDDLVVAPALEWYRAAAQLRFAGSLCRRRPPGWRERARRLLES